MVFARSSLGWGTYAAPANASIADVLVAYRSIPYERGAFLKYLDHWSLEADRLREEAAIVREPAERLTNIVERHLRESRNRAPGYAGGLTACDVVARAGGPHSFPLIATEQAVIRARLATPRKKNMRNDFLDEAIVSYAPYVTATVHDAGTVHRLRASELPWAKRVTKQLSEVPKLIDDVATGRLEAPQPFAIS